MNFSITPEEKQPMKSPEAAKRVLEHKINVHEKKINHEINDTWQSCCIKADRRAVQYFTQISIIVGVGAFCIHQIATKNSCDANPYMNLLSLLIGLVIPQPTVH